MHIDPSVSVGNLITIATIVLGFLGTSVLWIWKYSKRDDALHSTVKKHGREIKMLNRMVRKLAAVTRKSTLAALISAGKTTDEDLARFLSFDEASDEEDEDEEALA